MNTRKLMLKVTEKRGATLLCLHDYLNKSGELANHLINVNITYKNALAHDLNLMENSEDKKIEIFQKYGQNPVDCEKAWNNLYNSLVKTNATEEEKEILRANNDATINRSDAQKKAYIKLNGAMDYQIKEDGTIVLYIFGFRLRKTVKQEGVYKETKSRLETIIKRDIEKTLGFKSTKFKRFIIENAQEIALRGVVI